MKTIIQGTLVWVNGNAFAIMGHFQREARRAGWTAEEIREVLDDAKSSDYSHLISTIDAWFDDSDIDDDDDDEDDDY